MTKIDIFSGFLGAGKTTLLRCLNFLETADAGSITVAGETLGLSLIHI